MNNNVLSQAHGKVLTSSMLFTDGKGVKYMRLVFSDDMTMEEDENSVRSVPQGVSVQYDIEVGVAYYPKLTEQDAVQVESPDA